MTSDMPLIRRPANIVRLVWMLVALTLALMTIFPLFWMVSIAFKTPAEVFQSAMLPKAPSWNNFVYVLTEVPFLRYLGNSLLVSTLVTMLALWFHTMAGYALARLRFPGRETIFILIFSTFLVSLPVIIVPLFILVRTMGLLNSYAGMIVPAIFNAFGIFLLRQYYLSLPRELEEAALIDGAGYWRIYWSVILPLSRPIISALAILFFLANWNSFLWPLTVAADDRLWVVQVGISNFRSQYSASWNYIMAASTIVALPMLILFVVFQRQIIGLDQDQWPEIASRQLPHTWITPCLLHSTDSASTSPTCTGCRTPGRDRSRRRTLTAPKGGAAWRPRARGPCMRGVLAATVACRAGKCHPRSASSRARRASSPISRGRAPSSRSG